jgi:1-acyl-sn-glycerol-3-phosphate acyltransferase
MRFIQLKSESGQSASSASGPATIRQNLLDESPSQPATALPAPEEVARPIGQRAGDRFEFDEKFTRRILRITDPLMRAYFRAELRGAHNLPAEQTILVANHDGGMLPLDGFVLGSGWHHHHGFQKPLHVLVHDMVLRFAPWMRRVGAVLADRHNLDAVMDAGHSILVYPGASRETFRPFWERKRITLGSRTGFVKHALRRGVPITPVVSAGVHETFIVLCRGSWLAKRLSFGRLFRADVFPIVAGLPFGIWLGAMLPQLPLPAKITVQVLPAIDVRMEAASFLGRPPADADLDNPAVVDFCFHRIRDTMQHALNGLYAERRFPVIG